MPILDDALWAERLLEKEDNQFSRRAYVRNIFGMIEGSIWVIKQTILIAAKDTGMVKLIPVAEYALLSDNAYELKNNGEPKVQIKYLKLPENIKFTFKIIEKYLRIDLNLGIGTIAWENFLQAQEIRNKITHPKKSTEFEVSDKDIAIAKEVSSWFNDLIVGFFNGLSNNSKINGILYAYSDAIRPPFRGQTGHCSDVNPATIPRGIRPAFRADSGHFSWVGRN